MSNVAKIEPRSLTAGAKIQAIVPQSMEEAYRLGKAVCMAGMAPKGMDTPEKCMIAIMQGMEVGLSPMQSLQRIAVVNGRPTIWGDGAMSLVRASGICEYVRESIKGENDARIAGCVVKRRGEPEEVTRTFSVSDAKKAGLWGKAGPWTQYPERMLQMRARAFALRDVFADVLGGMYLREELEEDRRQGPPASSEPMPAMAPPPPPVAIEHHPATVTEAVDPTEFLQTLEYAMAGAHSVEDVHQAWADCDPEGTFDGDDVNREIAEKIRDRRLKQLEA